MLHYLEVCWFYSLIPLCFGSHTAWKHTTGALCKLAVNKVSGMRYVCNSARGWLMVMETLGDERVKANTWVMHRPNKSSTPPASETTTMTTLTTEFPTTTYSEKHWVDTVKATPVQYNAIKHNSSAIHNVFLQLIILSICWDSVRN